MEYDPKNPHLNDLLVTKLYIPKVRNELVVRPRLVDQLIAGKERKLILVTAPAGYGKTTLLTEWFSKNTEAVAWYSLDQADNDVGRFLSYCVSALQQVDSGICSSVLGIIRSPDPPPIDTLLTFIINDLACMRRYTHLVLDDFHLISDPKVHYALSYLLQNLPPNLQIVITSRAELPFSITDLRAKNQALVIDTFDLRFNHDETTEFVRKFFRVNLTPEQVNLLDQHTEGWVTGLQLAAISTRNDPEVEDILQYLSGDDRLIGDYLFNEVFSHQPEEVQQFMALTAGFRRFSAPLCDEVLETDNSQEIIDYLIHANLFIIPLDNKRTWYRYHHLLSELLQNQPSLLRKFQPTHYLRAAQWFEAHNYMEEAIEYGLEGEEYEYAAQLIDPRITKIISSGGRDQAIRWMQSIPKDILRRVGQLWQHYVIAWLDKGDFKESERIIDWIWNDLDQLPDVTEAEKNTIIGYKSVFLAAVAIHSKIDAVKSRLLTQKAAALLPENELLGQCIAYGHYGSACLHLGNVVQARSSLKQAMEMIEIIDYPLMNLLWSSYHAQSVAAQGELSLARKYYDEISRQSTLMGVHKSNVFSNAIIGMGNLYYEMNDLTQAESFFEEGIQIAENGDYLERLLIGYLSFAKIKIALGEYTLVEEKLAYAKTVANKNGRPQTVISGLEAIQARNYLAQGQFDNALRWASGMVVPTLDEDFNSSIDYQLRVLALVWLHEHRTEEAIDLILKLYDLAQSQERQWDLIQIGLTLVLAYDQAGDYNQAQKLLLRLLEIAVDEGYVRSFLDKGWRIHSVLVVLSQNQQMQISPSIQTYITQLVHAFEEENTRLSKLGIRYREPDSYQLLTSRELDVIQLLAAGLSYKNLSQELMISENTLKSHIKNIYTKLEVNNRTQAINRATQLGIMKNRV